jgi:hypothetical protein
METRQLLEQRQQLEAEHAAASATLKAFPRLGSGLTPDSVRNSADYRTAKATYDAAFQALRRFNQQYAARLRKLR